MKKLIVRHGDMCLEEISQLPEGLTKSDNNILMTGSGGNHHTYQDGEFFPKQVDRFIFGYFKSGPDCELFHKGHGQRDAGGNIVTKIVNGRKLAVTKVPANLIFALKKQQEDTHEGMKPVVD